MTISITADTAQVTNALRRLSKSVQGPALRNGLQAGAFLVEGEAKLRAPVDTGALRSSIRATEIKSTEYSVGTNLDYAIWQEYGTSRMAAQPYMRPALNLNRDSIIRTIAATIRSATR